MKSTEWDEESKVFNSMISEVAAFVNEKGWQDDRTFGDEIALLHSEVSEALEAYRRWGYNDATTYYDNDGSALPKPEGVGSEFADILIRLLDDCGRHNIDLFAEYRRKMDYNWQRTYRHGGKKL